MKLWKLICIGMWIIPVQATLSSEWAHSQACYAAQKGNWKQAQDALKELLVENPDRPDFLYDAGVAAYTLKEFEKAVAYFSAAADQMQVDPRLKKQAFFNAGNSYVALQKLKGALTAYEQALEVDPDDEKVRHNRDKVKEMLEQQKQQQQEKQQQDQNNDQSKNQEQQDQEQSSQEDQKQNDSTDENQGKNSQSNSQNKSKNDSGKAASENGKSSEGKQEEEQGADDQQRGDHDDQVGDESDSDQAGDKKDQFSDDHTSSSQHNRNSEHKKSASQPIKQDEKEQEMQEGMEDPGDYRQEEREGIEQALPEHQKWMARALHKLEQIEEKEQKKLIKAQMYKQAEEHDGQNCW